jgi:SAM-dependent methyltransferase
MRVCLACSKRFESGGWQCPECGWQPPLHGVWPVFAPDLASQNDGFITDAFSTLFEAEHRHFWFRARNKLLIWAIRTHFPAATSFLEIGCGTGYVLSGVQAALPAMQYSGSELLLEGLAFAATRLSGVSLSQMSALDIPFDGAFDVVGAFDVLEHITEDERAIAQIFQATAPGGGIVITVPQHQWLWSAVDEYSCHKRRYSRADLLAKLEYAGFREARATSFVSLLLPLMLVSRTMRPTNREFDRLAEIRIGRTANSVMERIMDLERGLIKLGVDLPVGGSLLAVARKPKA